MRRLLRWLRFGRIERRDHLTLITTPAGVYAVEDGIPSFRPGTAADHEPPSLYDWEREGL